MDKSEIDFRRIDQQMGLRVRALDLAIATSMKTLPFPKEGQEDISISRIKNTATEYLHFLENGSWDD